MASNQNNYHDALDRICLELSTTLGYLRGARKCAPLRGDVAYLDTVIQHTAFSLRIIQGLRSKRGSGENPPLTLNENLDAAQEALRCAIPQAEDSDHESAIREAIDTIGYLRSIPPSASPSDTVSIADDDGSSDDSPPHIFNENISEAIQALDRARDLARDSHEAQQLDTLRWAMIKRFRYVPPELYAATRENTSSPLPESEPSTPAQSPAPTYAENLATAEAALLAAVAQAPGIAGSLIQALGTVKFEHHYAAKDTPKAT